MSDIKRTVSEQDRDLNNLAKQVEDLKRNNGSSSSSSCSAGELSSLKREVSDQDRELDNLKRTAEDLREKQSNPKNGARDRNPIRHMQVLSLKACRLTTLNRCTKQ